MITGIEEYGYLTIIGHYVSTANHGRAEAILQLVPFGGLRRFGGGNPRLHNRVGPGKRAPRFHRCRMLKLVVTADSLRLIAIDIDGTLLNPEFQISAADLAALRRAHGEGIEIILVTGRRHTFALPIAEQLGFDLWLISSNGAITRSLGGETFHRDLLPEATCRELVHRMQEFRGQTVLTFDSNGSGAIVIERLDKLESSIQRWLEKNMQYIQFVVPIEKALTTHPVQAMFCGPVADMRRVLQVLGDCGLPITVLRTEYPGRDLSIIDVLNAGCSKGHALERWVNYRRITREQVMAVGDNYNDIEMLAFAGRPFIMGNASAELRGRGWTLTHSNAESGVAAAIEHVLYGKELPTAAGDETLRPATVDSL
jgi:Cof subfamily protein (haloacid dehalogenase superfamily)